MKFRQKSEKLARGSARLSIGLATAVEYLVILPQLLVVQAGFFNFILLVPASFRVWEQLLGLEIFNTFQNVRATV